MKLKDFTALAKAYAEDEVRGDYQRTYEALLQTLPLRDRVSAFRVFQRMAHVALRSIDCKHEKVVHQYDWKRVCEHCGASSTLSENRDQDSLWSPTVWSEWTYF